jgi:hypothetical protein
MLNKIRPINENDKLLIEKSIAVDPDHSGKSNVDFWLPQDRTNCFAVEDEKGVLFYIRAENVLRLHMQAVPANDKEERARLAKGIDDFAAHIKEAAKKTYRQIIFESVYAPLIRFLHQRGYRASKDEHICDL